MLCFIGYESRYGGLEPATYTMPGDPGGLARVDDILGTNMYKSTFTASPMVFGAFPSLHSACAWQLAFFLVFIFGPRSIPFAVGYVFWIWWATMYLGHHYVVDLVGGAGYAVVAFWIGSFFLPSVLPQQHYNNAKASHVIHDLGDAMNHQEKQTLFDATHEDDFVGFKNSGNNKEWDLSDSYDQDEDNVEEMADVIVVSVEQPQIEEYKETQFEPSSPTSSVTSSKKNAAFRQSWNGWQGYESWMEVLSTVNSPRISPRASPDSSPRNSTAHGSHNSRRFSRDSIRSVTTLNLDSEANSALVQGSTAYASPMSSPSKRDSFLNSVSSSLKTIVEDTGSSLPMVATKGRTRPGRLFLEQSVGSSSTSLPNSPLTDHHRVEFDSESSYSISSSSSSRPTSPRSFASVSPSPALGKRFKDE